MKKLVNKYQIGGTYKRDSHTGVIYLPYVSKIKPYDDSKTSVQLNKPILSLSGKSMEMDNKLLAELDDYLKSKNVGLPQRQAILYNVVQEGSTTKSHGNGAHGLLGWRGVRIPRKSINQMEYLYNTIFGKYNANHWKDRSGQQAFINAETVEDALTYGYVRPGLEQREFRSKTKYFNEIGGS